MKTTHQPLPATLPLNVEGSFCCAPQGNWSTVLRATDATENGLGVVLGLSRNAVGLDDDGQPVSAGIEADCTRTLSLDEAERFALAILAEVTRGRMVEGARRIAKRQAEDDKIFGRQEWYQQEQRRAEERREELRQPI